MGELHLDIIIDRLKREFKVECNQGQPQVAYKEAVTQTCLLYTSRLGWTLALATSQQHIVGS